MSEQNVIEFLRTVAARADLLQVLMTRSKDEVIAVAGKSGFPFTEQEFDSLIWGLEARLAEWRGEEFDGKFTLWETMWGRYYLEYLVTDVVPALLETGLVKPAQG